ncbi:MAG TPA: biopolymer transporter ExbD [Allosphingosinicella sp.]|nr:biopolymer transporter ExbD [Allosphingosinicella sp.]
MPTRTRTRRIAFATVAEAPISGINTTPLIDVLLVLLIMFILTIPIASHSVKIRLPGPGTPADDKPVVHRLAIQPSGALAWDGAAIAGADLPARLAAFHVAEPQGVLEMQAEAETRYERFDKVLAVVKRAGIEKLGFVGNERFAEAVRG